MHTYQYVCGSLTNAERDYMNRAEFNLLSIRDEARIRLERLEPGFRYVKSSDRK